MHPSIYRADNGLATLLRYENVAWYENGKVRILDRRIYPEMRFVECFTYQEVAEAIRLMVTQSLGPYLAAGMGMALAAYQARDLSDKDFKSLIEDAAYCLSRARPTTSTRMIDVAETCKKAALDARESGEKADEAVFYTSLYLHNKKYESGRCVAKNLVDMLPKSGTIITQCFAESSIGFTFQEIKNRGLDVKVICTETRPYFQGARLTASVAYEQGLDVTVITDNMPAWTMVQRNVTAVISAGDAVTMDGYVVNKVGTLQLAICAHHFGIPFFVTNNPDRKHQSIDSVVIEERDEKDVLHALGKRVTMDGVHGYYPAFDATPPTLISGIVTDKGIFSPYNLSKYFNI